MWPLQYLSTPHSIIAVVLMQLQHLLTLIQESAITVSHFITLIKSTLFLYLGIYSKSNLLPNFTLIVLVLGDNLLHYVLLKITDTWSRELLLADVSRMFFNFFA